MRATTRVGASICFSVFSLVSIILLLPSSRVSTQLQKITLGSLDDFPALWPWGTLDDDWGGDGVRLVVFGDSWVHDSNLDGKGTSWADKLCEEINCTSYVNFAKAQSIESYPSTAPAGVMTSNSIHLSSLASSSLPPPKNLAADLLPDLSSQIKEFVALPPPSTKPKETLFLLSFGLWDVYNYASLDYGLAMNITDRTVSELFDQLNTLYWHYSQNLSAAHITPEPDLPTNTTEVEKRAYRTTPPPFRVIIPKVFDPTLLPGWISQRPVPLKPSSVAEHQKNAVYLAGRWNNVVENKIGPWIKEPTVVAGDNSNATIEMLSALPEVAKDVFYYDLPQSLLDIMIEHQLEEEGLSDAAGLGKGESPFESVDIPCVRSAVGGAVDGLVDLNGQLVCKEPEDYLFWDSFNLGCVVKEQIGKEVGAMVRLRKSIRSMWEEKEKSIVHS